MFARSDWAYKKKSTEHRRTCTGHGAGTNLAKAKATEHRCIHAEQGRSTLCSTSASNKNNGHSRNHTGRGVEICDATRRFRRHLWELGAWNRTSETEHHCPRTEHGAGTKIAPKRKATEHRCNHAEQGINTQRALRKASTQRKAIKRGRGLPRNALEVFASSHGCNLLEGSAPGQLHLAHLDHA